MSAGHRDEGPDREGGGERDEHLNRVVQSVSDATKRLSQISNCSTANTKTGKRKNRDTVGPWKLGKTLGKGSSGRVRLAKNMQSGKLAAIKIVPKRNVRHNQKQVTALPYGIEREIIIMKLITHPNIMALYEVWENKSELYLVLEYVEGGELFDYLIARGKLPEQEAIHYFKQIVQGVSYCHNFNICHRDLKPENLLLDKKNKTVKIADFGMAALETTNRLLETSCGSPHYASPEIVMGQKYHGSPSDVWSCGIILFALLTGHLPFNDDNVRKLLLKVQHGKYQMPANVSKEAKDLISKILVVDPAKRITVDKILEHPLLSKYDNSGKGGLNCASEKPEERPKVLDIHSVDDIDETILNNLQILWHGAPKEYLVEKLLQSGFTEEKLFYALLLRYQQRQSVEPTSISSNITSTNGNGAFTKTSNQDQSVINAPKVVQKSQFSINSLLVSPKKTKEGYVASSSRVFKHSVSRRSLHVSPSPMKSSTSCRSLKSSSSKRLQSPNPKAAAQPAKVTSPQPRRRTLHNSASKRSLYSLTSISKRSLNLNEFLQEGTDVKTPKLPSIPLQDQPRREDPKTPTETTYGADAHGGEKPTFISVLHDYPTVDSEGMVFKSSSGTPMIAANAPIIQPAFIFGVGAFPGTKQPSSNSLCKPSLNSQSSPKQSQDAKVSSMRETLKDRRALELEKRVSSHTSESMSPIFPPVRPVIERKHGSDLTAVRDTRSVVKEKRASLSLDPRRTAPEPPRGIETLLRRYSLKNSIKSRSSLKKKRDSGAWSITDKTIFQDLGQVPEDEEQEKESEEKGNDTFIASTEISDTTSSKFKITTSTPIKKDDATAMSSGKVPVNSEQSESEDEATNFDSNTHSYPIPADLKIEDVSTPIKPQGQTDLLRMPSSFMNSSNTFANLNNFISNIDKDYSSGNSDSMEAEKKEQVDKAQCEQNSAQKHPRTLAPGGYLSPSIPRLESENSLSQELGSRMSDLSDLSFANDMPTYTNTAHAVSISPGTHNVCSFSPLEPRSLLDVSSNGKMRSNLHIPLRQLSEDMCDKTITTQEGESVNIFEDAPEEEGSLTTSTSGSVPNIHRKAISIDTMNTSCALMPVSYMRTSIHMNGDSSVLDWGTSDGILPKTRPLPTSNHVRKKSANRLSNNLTLSKSMMSMFKNLDQINVTDIQDPMPVSDLLSKGVDPIEPLEPLKNDQATLKAESIGAESDSINMDLADRKHVTILHDNVSDINSKSKRMENCDKESLGSGVPQAIHLLPTGNKELKSNETLLTPIMESPAGALSATSLIRKETLSSDGKSAKDETKKPSKGNWFIRLIMSFTKPKKTLIQEHTTVLPFDDVNIITLQQFSYQGVEYEIRQMERRKDKQKVEYDCRLLDGDFKFKINIYGENSAATKVSVKQKGRSDELAFMNLNADIETLIKAKENAANVK
ncbi:AaceriABL034Wp [[Ashbya] aceris (nom. inval.)]|nr:AaceriABL034Wp [[Ashbya] aceris (nom. inval.)]